MAIGTNPGGGTLSGTTTVAAVSGVATFAGLSIDKSGTGYTLTASDGALTGATSTTFNITVGPAAKLAFTSSPAARRVGWRSRRSRWWRCRTPAATRSPASTASITLAIGTNPGGGTLTCTTNPKAAVAGVDTFAGCKIDKAGAGYTLTATSGALASATSAPVQHHGRGGDAGGVHDAARRRRGRVGVGDSSRW